MLDSHAGVIKNSYDYSSGYLATRVEKGVSLNRSAFRLEAIVRTLNKQAERKGKLMVTRIVRDCDQHAQDDQFVPAGEWEVTMAAPGEKPVTFKIDLCSECEKPLISMSELFEEIARASKTPAAHRPTEDDHARPTADGQLPCPVCAKTYASRSALGSHCRRVHGKSLGELDGSEIKFICLRCDTQPKFDSGTGFSAHRRSVHDLGPDATLLEGEKLTDEPSRFSDRVPT